MYFFERICGYEGGSSQELLNAAQHDIFAREEYSYEWLKDVEMEDVEDSKDDKAP